MPVIVRWLLQLGPTNPIAVRLVQGGSRRTRHLYIRAGYLGVLVAVLLYTLLLNVSAGSVSYRELAKAGATSFMYIAYLQILLICILAPVFMAGAIAQEANPRTWDILLTTPLSATQVVLGNLLGRLFFILALLFSTLPLFAITQYFGGVPGSSIFASYLIAACAAMVVAAAAVALSVSRLVGKRAVFAFYVAVVSYMVVTLGIDRVVSAGSVTYMTGLNPFLALRALLEPTGYPSAPAGTKAGFSAFMLERPVVAWCVLSTGLSVVLLGLSVATVRLGGLGNIGAGASSVPWYRRVFGLGRAGAEYRAPRHVWHNPIAWREAAARNATLGRMAARWSFIGAGGLFGLGLVLWYHGGSMTTVDFRLVLLYTVIGELVVVTLVAVNMAATAVAREREDGTLDLLLTTPITPSAYLSGKLRGMIAYLLPMLAVPLGTLGLAGAYVGLVSAGVMDRAGGVMVRYTQPGGGLVFDIPAVLPEAALMAALVVVPFTAFCVMVGLQRSLSSRGSLGSVAATVAIVGVISGIVGLCAWRSGSDVAFIGPALAGLSPASMVFATIEPEWGLAETLSAGGPGPARFTLAVGAVLAAGVYASVVYGIHLNMVRTFDMTVRRLAGNK